ncbi:MAG: SDR family oxidoreductase [Gammaproteobacteria bacterium]|nr:SDR family oxidoreductase [Gammaproteobacteria bacterium]
MIKRFATALMVFVGMTFLAGASVAAENGMMALVTGANRGIGLELVQQMQAAGYNVIGTARKPAEAKELNASGARVLQLDVSDSASVSALAASLKGQAIDVLINNAGIKGHTASSFEETDFDQIAQTFDINTLGPMRVTQALLPNILASKGKTIVQMSSTLGSITNNSGGLLGYRASKTALNMFNSSLALELAERGVTAIVIHPGWVQTRLGGASAPITTQESVAGMLSVIESLSTKDNGRFVDYQGNELPW